MDRRGFLRVALLGGAGAATMAVCPEIVEQAVSKTYCFLRGDARDKVWALIEKMYADAAEHMAEQLALDTYLCGLTVAPGYIRVVGDTSFDSERIAKQYKASVEMPMDSGKWLVDLG